MVGDEPVGTFSRARARAREGTKGRRAGQLSRERRERLAARVDLSIGRDEVPRLHLALLVHSCEQLVGLGVLERDGAQTFVAIPEKDLAERPFAEAAVGVVEDRRRSRAGRRMHGPKIGTPRLSGAFP